MLINFISQVIIYTDGACSGNPGKGGFGVVMLHNERKLEFSQGFVRTTNNRMELRAVISGLEKLKHRCEVSLYTDSRYVVAAVEERWLQGWIKNNWRKADRKPVLNKDLWEQLSALLKLHSVKFIWVKGHAANPLNERCDQLAVMAYNTNELIEDEGYTEQGDLQNKEPKLL